MFQSTFRSTSTTTGLLLAAVLAGLPAAQGQEALEEIVVTARKVSESLQEAPLSVVVFSGETLEKAGVSRIEELVAFVPNFALSETGIGTNLYVRGIGSGINQGFEQSVGLYIDGIYYGRGQLARAPFMDMAQVEALRGPQAILLGNNSIAGALSFTTAKPTDTFEGSVSGMYVPEQNEQEFNAVISGPLSDKWSARFAGRYRGTDGYQNNNILNRDEPNRDEKSGRLTFAYAGDSFDGTIKFEKNQFDVKGRQIEISRADPVSLPPNTGCFTPNAGCPSQTGFSNNTGSSQLWQDFQDQQIAATGVAPNYLQYLNEFFDPNPAILDGTVNYTRGSNGDRSDNDINVVAGTLNFPIGDNTLTITAAHLDYDYLEDCDCDFTGANLFILQSTEEFQQNSLEVRWTSPQEERFRYLAGAYYQHDELDFGDQIFLPIGSGVVQLVGYATTGNPQGANDSLGNTSAFRDFDQNTTTSSVFGQVGLDVTDRWKSSLGVRYSHIEKEAIRILREGDLERVPYNLNDANGFDRLSAGGFLFASIFKVAFHDLSGFRTENNTAFEFTNDFQVTDDLMVYGSVKTGFKGGGFDARSNSDPNVPIPGTSRPDKPVADLLETQTEACTSAIAFAGSSPLLTGSGSLFPTDIQQQVCQNVSSGSFEFEDEKALAFEVGTKMSLLNNTAELNIALFRTNFDNLQVSIFDGTLGFNVGNAAQAVTQGVEIDGRWSITDNWSMSGSAGFLDFNFEDFPNGQCNQGQAPNSPGGFCSYTGKTNQYVAQWSGTAAVSYEHPVGAFVFKSTLDTQMTTPYNPSQNLDSRVEQAGYALWNLRVALAADDETWEVAVLGRNLSDRAVVSYANDTPLAYSQFGTPTFYAFVDQPRTIAVQASYRFGD